MHPSPFPLRKMRIGLALLGILLSCCQTQEPQNSDAILRLKLNDSLSRYDSLTIVLLYMGDTAKVLETVWQGPLPTTSRIPDHKLTSARDLPFIVKVQGWMAGGQLALETWIYYGDGKKEVKHVAVPPLIPRNFLAKLNPTVGSLAPAFNKDSLTYRLVAPLGIDKVTFEIQAVLAGALVLAEGDTLRAGATPKPFPAAARPDTFSVSVIDLGMAREYRVIVSAEPPPKLGLASLVVSAGTLKPAFDTAVRKYTVDVPSNNESVTLTLQPIDTRNVNMTILARAVFPGVPSQPINLEPGFPETATIEVSRGEERVEYIVVFTRAPPH